MNSAHPIIYSAANVGVCYRSLSGKLNSKSEWVLRGLDLEIYQGESLAIVGRNGAGKSTLMRLIAGIIEEDEGIIKKTGSAKAALLSLQAGFISDLSGLDNIYLSAVLLGLSKSQVDSKLQAIIDYADLGSHIHKSISTYSSGMRARLGFSIALYSEPEVVLVDEVLGVGDEEFKEKSTRAIHEMVKSDQTVVFVSHAPAIVKELCDRAVWLENGRVVYESTPENVLKRYSQFNSICSMIAKDNGWTESEARLHENNKNPMETIARFHNTRSK
ncbi:ABC transporter ATP-binding protein [Oceanicoccus sp. KOV_DT_Chl]|uniref:ABC transporter ATP-binding protein n=1 Tax=Oceanicoccus sp. KOV_DT_Chl TaxID=1904639 RepID=UPI0011AEEDB7|nr:ATP-binding cassette domain-containing protein [Oceanicoccus sp. KOV_DT_Chl]